MNILKLDDLPLYDLGNTIQISGMILQGNDKTYNVFFPDKKIENPELVEVNEDEWKKLLLQLDTLETVLFPGNPGAKIVVRKSQRIIESAMIWKVFRRDNYTCQYCGARDKPLSVDHVVLWEDMGGTVEENLLTACSACNMKRGNMRFLDWLDSDYYNKCLKNFGNEDQQYNQDKKLLDFWIIARDLPLRTNKRGR